MPGRNPGLGPAAHAVPPSSGPKLRRPLSRPRPGPGSGRRYRPGRRGMSVRCRGWRGRGVRAHHLPGPAVRAAVADAPDDHDGRRRGPPPLTAADRYHDRRAVAWVDSGDAAVPPGHGRNAEGVDRAHRVHGREAVEFDLLAGGRAGERVGDTDHAVGGVDEVGGLQFSQRGVREAQARGGAGDPAGGWRVSGLQEPAQHRPVQLAQRPGQRCLAAGAADPAWLIWLCHHGSHCRAGQVVLVQPSDAVPASGSKDASRGYDGGWRRAARIQRRAARIQ
jgi:hypothetical protein